SDVCSSDLSTRSSSCSARVRKLASSFITVFVLLRVLASARQREPHDEQKQDHGDCSLEKNHPHVRLHRASSGPYTVIAQPLEFTRSIYESTVCACPDHVAAVDCSIVSSGEPMPAAGLSDLPGLPGSRRTAAAPCSSLAGGSVVDLAGMVVGSSRGGLAGPAAELRGHRPAACVARGMRGRRCAGCQAIGPAGSAVLRTAFHTVASRQCRPQP